MTVYTYDNTKIDAFTTFDGGNITVGSSENIDYGDINQNVEPERDSDFFFVNDRGLITATADILPFGPIEVVDGRDEFGRSRSQWIPENANTVLFDVNDSALESAVTPWVGTGNTTLESNVYTVFDVPNADEFVTTPSLSATSNGVLGLNTATLYSSIMYAERFTNGPYNIQNNGDQIKITLNVALD